MNYFSTRDKSLKFSFKDIFLRGLAPEGGLFLPSEIKKFNQAEVLFPQSEWAPKSSLMASYAYYVQDYYSDAIMERRETQFDIWRKNK